MLAKGPVLANLRGVKKQLWPWIVLVLCLALVVAHAAQSAAAPAPAKPAAKSSPGMDIAHTVTTVTGVAISPLLGVGAVGAYQHFNTPEEQRANLPWYTQPYFFVPALLLVAFVALKDVLGTAAPTALKSETSPAPAPRSRRRRWGETLVSVTPVGAAGASPPSQPSSTGAGAPRRAPARIDSMTMIRGFRGQQDQGAMNLIMRRAGRSRTQAVPPGPTAALDAADVNRPRTVRFLRT